MFPLTSYRNHHAHSTNTSEAKAKLMAEPDLFGTLQEQERRCSYCKEYKPLSEFHKDRNKKYGVGYVCKECMKTYKAKYKPVTEKYCSVCHELKPASEYTPHLHVASRLSPRCKQCQNATSNRKKLDKRNVQKNSLLNSSEAAANVVAIMSFRLDWISITSIAVKRK